MDAASTGEAARLRAAFETVKGDIVHLKSEQVWANTSQFDLKIHSERFFSEHVGHSNIYYSKTMSC